MREKTNLERRKKKAISLAMDLGYVSLDETIIARILAAKSERDIERILHEKRLPTK